MRRQIEQFTLLAHELDPLQEARLQLALARASTRSRLHVEAIAAYARALDLDANALSLGDLANEAEQYVYRAIERSRSGEGPAARLRSDVEHALARGLERHANLLAIRPTREQFVLHGRASQRAALLRSGAARHKTLQSAQRSFAAASSRHQRPTR